MEPCNQYVMDQCLDAKKDWRFEAFVLDRTSGSVPANWKPGIVLVRRAHPIEDRVFWRANPDPKPLRLPIHGPCAPRRPGAAAAPMLEAPDGDDEGVLPLEDGNV